MLDAEPLNPAKGTRGGMRITSSELLEISLVAIGADTNALVVARGYRARPGASAVLRSLPSLSADAIERARAQIGRAPVQHRPVALMPDHERMALYQRERSAHVMTVWGLQQGERERESDYSREAAGRLAAVVGCGLSTTLMDGDDARNSHALRVTRTSPHH